MKRKGKKDWIRPKLVAMAVAACFASETGYANPVGPVVVNGQVTFGGAGSVLTVTNSPNAIINWQQFSIGAGETTRFIQQSAASAVLNRVVGADPSSILGALQSNGRVFLINPNGIVFGPGSQVDVAGLVASTLNLSNEDFLGGRLNFVGDPASAGAVANHGRITAGSGGRVYLVGSAVDNQGVITAPNGDVVLAAGKSVRVTESPGSRLQVEIAAPADSAVNLGEAVYGSRGIYGGLVRNSGTISASSAVRTADGRIILKASKDVMLEGASRVAANGTEGGSVTAQAEAGTVLVGGAIQATGSEGTGGTVQLLGEQVGLAGNAAVDASGAGGGGTINVGGSRQGEGPLLNSRAVFVGSDAHIAANATAAGDGGTVIVYADDAARIHGALEAKGGSQGGNGGFVETSGKQYLDVTGVPDVTAAGGDGGEWLIDPYNITITTTVNQCSNLTGCVAGPDWTSSANNAQLGVNLINNALDAGTSVTVTTGAGGTQAGNVTFANNAAVNKTAGGNASLTVTAANNIRFNNAGATIMSSSGQLDVSLDAGGAITNLRAIDLNGGTLTLNSPTTITQAAGGISGTGSLVMNGTGTLTLSQNNAYTGATTINAGTARVTNAAGLGSAAGVTTVNTGATLELRGNQVWAEPVTLSGGTLSRGTGNPTLTGAVDLAADSIITGGAGTLTLSGDVSGAGALTKTGSNTLVLSGNNAYTGATNINAGTLRVTSAGALGGAMGGTMVSPGGTLALNGTLTWAEPVTLAGGTLSRAGGNPTLTGAVDLTVDSIITAAGGTLTLSGAMSGAGGISKTGNGVLLLSGSNVYSGATTVNAGTLRVAGGNGIGDASAVTMAGGTLDINSTTEIIGSLVGTRPVTLGNGELITGGNNASTTYTGAISGAGGTLTKEGAGTLTLSGNNTYTGATNINGGTLALGNNNRISNASEVTVAAGATFELATFTETIGSLAGAGTVRKSGGGTDTLTVGGNNTSTTFSGAIQNSAGILNVTKRGTGTLTLAGANTYTGTTTVSSGTLRFSGGGSLDPTNAVVLANGAGVTLDLNGTNQTIGSLAGGGGAGGVVTNSAAGAVTLTTGDNDTSTAFAGLLQDGSGTLALSKVGTGTFTLSGNNTYTGATTISAGTLALGNNERIADTSAVTVAAGAVFELGTRSETIGSLAGSGTVSKTGGGTDTLTVGGDNTSTTFSGVIQNSAGTLHLTKQGAGTLSLAGANTYTGTTTINAGTLVASNDSALGTTARGTTVASGATLEIAAGVAIGAEALNLSGAGVGGNGAMVVASGSGSFAGAFTLGANASLGGDGNLTLIGTVNDTAPGTSTLTQAGSGTLTFSNTVGATRALAGVTTSAGQITALNGGSVRTTGSQTYGGTVTISGATTLTSTAGGNLTAKNAANDFVGDLGLNTSGAASIVDSGALALGASSVGTLVARALGGDLALNVAITASGGGDSIVLATSGNFVNGAGPAGLDPGAGRWLVYSTDPTLDIRGGLPYSFKQYNAPYATAPAGAGSGFLYSVAPVITPSLIGAVSKIYDGTTAAALTAGNYTLSGAIDDDTVALNNPAAGNYDTQHVGTGKQVTASGIAIASATNGGATVYGYQLSSTTASGNIGDITQRALTVTAASDTKVYDGGTSSAGAPTATGLVGGDTVGSLTQSFASKDVLGVNASMLNVDAGYVVNDGNAGANYTVTLNAASGTITPAPLSFTADDASRPQGAPNPPFTATYSGFQGGETPAVLTGTLSFSTPAMTSSPAGSYLITPFGQTSTNYAMTYIDGTLTVTGGISLQPGLADRATNLVIGGLDRLGIAFRNDNGASCAASNDPNGVVLMAGERAWAGWACSGAGR